MSGRILIVDDLPANIKLLEAKLSKEYYDTLSARSGKEALAIIDENEVDVILLDVMMPEMDGFEVCKLIKSNPKTEHIPIVMVTALSEVEDRVAGLQAGADDFLTKPIVDIALFARIRSLIRLKSLFDELHLKNQQSNDLIYLNNFNDYSNAKIIIFDDDMAQSSFLEKTLLEFCNSVTLIQECKDGAESLVDASFDLIIINSQLNDIDGLRISARIKNKPELRNIPILLLIEEGNNELLSKALDLGASDYLTMPIDANEAIVRTKTQIKKKKFQDAIKSNVRESFVLAVKDGLTGGYNRHYLDHYGKILIEEAHSKNRNLSVIMIDIDHFKMVNDQYGHPAGDALLKQIFTIISSCLSESDMLVRYGGEEFLIILNNTSITMATNKAEDIRKKVETFMFKLSETVTLKKTISLGVSNLKPEDNMLTLINNADQALYKAKNSGRNKVEVN